MDINQVTLVGRLADNVIYTPAQGTRQSRAVARLIVNRPPAGDGQRRLDAIQIVAWGKHADNMAQYTSKGKELGVSGEIRTNYVAPKKEGDPGRNYVEVLVRSISFGRDSNQQKMMKALQTGAAPVQGMQQLLAAVAQKGAGLHQTALLEMIRKDPTILTKLQKLFNTQATAPAAPSSAPSDLEGDIPFSE